MHGSGRGGVIAISGAALNLGVASSAGRTSGDSPALCRRACPEVRYQLSTISPDQAERRKPRHRRWPPLARCSLGRANATRAAALQTCLPPPEACTRERDRESESVRRPGAIEGHVIGGDWRATSESTEKSAVSEHPGKMECMCFGGVRRGYRRRNARNVHNARSDSVIWRDIPASQRARCARLCYPTPHCSRRRLPPTPR